MDLWYNYYMIKQPKGSVITGVKALYLNKAISFNSEVIDFILPSGSNVSYYKDHYSTGSFTTQLKKISSIGKIEKDGNIFFGPERLLIDIDKFEMDEILKDEAIRNLIRMVDPSELKRMITKLKSVNRFTISSKALEILEKKYMHFINKDVERSDVEEHLKLYVSNRLFESDITHFIKGGTAVEIYTSKRRGTLDTNGFFNIEEHNNIIEALTKVKDDIYFEVSDYNGNDFNNIKEYKRTRMVLKPKSKIRYYSSILNDLDITLMIDVDYSKDINELNEIIKDFNIKGRKIDKLNRMYMPISSSMLIGDKIQSALDSINKKTWRAKDLMDVHNLLKIKDYKKEDIIKWFVIKVKGNDKYSFSDYKDFLKTIKEDKDKYLDSLTGTLKTYNTHDFDLDNVLTFIEDILKNT